jgi:hypothetical protein
MSLELHIFLQDSQVPSRDAWQQAIEKAGFPTVLEPTLDLRQDTGFRPTSYKYQATGYEFCLEPAAGILEAYPHIADQVGSRDMCATFRWGGDLLECAAAISSAAVLTKLAGGIYFYPADDIIRTAADVVEATREELNSI